MNLPARIAPDVHRGYLDQVSDYLRRLGLSWADVTRGCEDCTITNTVLANVPWAGAAVWVLRQLSGDPMPIRGWYRCTACNARRAGSSRSRHLAGAAVDVDPDDVSSTFANLRRWADSSYANPAISDQWARLVDLIKRILRWPDGLGFIVYRSGAIHIDVGCIGSTECDDRSADWIDMQRSF